MSTQDSRIKIKRSTVAGVVPTVPASNDHTDGTWIATDIYKGELYYNQADNILFTRADSGVVTISDPSCICIKSASLTIASADVLQLNTTPLTIVAAQGAGTAIELISATFKGTFNSIAYATNTDIDIRTIGSSVNLTTNVAKLGFTANTLNAFALKADPSADQMIENTGLEVFVDTGDPTAGDSDIKVYVVYRVITL